MNHQNITTIAPAHRDARMNRVILAGTFKALRHIGLPRAGHIALMQEAKDRIRRHDAEAAAWFTGPTRATWLQARHARGELEGWSHDRLGREIMGVLS